MDQEVAWCASTQSGCLELQCDGSALGAPCSSFGSRAVTIGGDAEESVRDGDVSVRDAEEYLPNGEVSVRDAEE